MYLSVSLYEYDLAFSHIFDRCCRRLLATVFSSTPWLKAYTGGGSHYPLWMPYTSSSHPKRTLVCMMRLIE
ncbi:hypothetical protein I3842_09G145000 [Carya illinoinensis]|uniref:Uncharacterized protein n=1 Tax=Carya illinoinensis TaxID=32201 RepID=A0A922E636_CARIL|nr:hypothetical protein I3842_09G145000 [Carya illinoinensis]